MINLRSLMDLLPYYFKEQDTYKVNGKGLLERYLDIFGAYFDNQVVKNIDTLDDIIDFDKTPEVYLGYLWEFLGSMPYANPKAIDPDKWSQYFNGFDDDTTITALSRLWLYRKDSDNDHYNLNLNQVRALVKYSIALFAIRGTKKFFEVLLRLYGFDVVISNGSTYPKITIEDDGDSDYWGTDTDYWGTDDDYFGSTDSIFDIKSEVTKLDSEWMNLDEDCTDNHSNCTRLVNVNFRLKSNYTYSIQSNEFRRLQDRMFNLINMFLPIGTRPHIIWDNVNAGNKYVPKVPRSIEVYVDRVPVNWTASDNVFVESVEYPGWYRVYDRSTANSVPIRDFDWSQLKFMVKVKDSYTDSPFRGQAPAFISDQPKKFVVAFNGEDYSDIEYEDGHVFTLNPGGDNIYYPKFKVSVICEEDFDLSNGELKTFTIRKWLKEFNYHIFKHYNNSVDTELSNNNTYIPILIQSASIRTYTNDANPDDDEFTPQPVVNLTTGEILTLCVNSTTIDSVDYSQYEGRCMYVQHIYEPGVYEFAMLNKQEYRFTLEVTRVKEVLTTTLVEGLVNNSVSNEEPTCDIRLESTSNLNFLKKISTLPIKTEGGELPTVISASSLVGNKNNKAYYHLEPTNIYHINSSNRATPINFNLVFLSKPVSLLSQYLKLVIKEFASTDPRNPAYSQKTVIFYPVTGELDVSEEALVPGEQGGYHMEYRRGRQVLASNGYPLMNQFQISTVSENTGMDSNGDSIPVKGVSKVGIGCVTGLFIIASHPDNTRNTFYVEYSGLYDDEVLIKETSNPVTKYWNNGEKITLDDPGHYRFYGVNNYFDNVISNHVDINVISNKYNAHYYLELEDGDKSDDESYMIRTLIPSTPASGSVVMWGFDFLITVDKTIVEATDILAVDPNAFDLEVVLYRGGNPNRGTLIDSYTATVEVDTDDLGNILPHYKVKGHIQLVWDGTYTLHPITIGEGNDAVTYTNCPPGLFCVELHDIEHVWPDTPSYRVVDAYVVPQKFDGNLYFDVDVISKAWTSPAGQVFDIDPITGKYTWGWFKSNSDYLHSVRLVRYDPAIETPQFRLKLTNNTIGYTRVYMYKLVDNGSEWDDNAAYPSVLPPKLKSGTSTPYSSIDNPHWLNEAIPKDWGFPGDFDPTTGNWDYGKGETGVVGYSGRWLFTGTVYQLGEVITGPQEPGKYLFLINQLSVDNKSINYAYLEVKEEITYSLIVDPLLAILQGTAVGTKVDAVSSAKFTKELLAVTVTPPNSEEILEYHQLPYAFYAYQAGTYTFKLYKFEGGQWIYLDLMANFKVLTDNGISDEYLSWEWSDTSDREVQVVTTSADVDWTVRVQNE